MKIQRGKKASHDFPKFGVIMGAAKVGKSTFMAQREKTLILDLEPAETPEDGAYFGIDIKGGYAQTSQLEGDSGLYEYLKWYFSEDNQEYDILAIDHLREISSVFNKAILEENNVGRLSDVGWGKGTNDLRSDIESFIKALAKKATLKKRVILLAHCSDRNGEIRLDVDGKNENLVFSNVDYIGYLYRQGQEGLNISFQHAKGQEAGCRNKFLSRYNGPANMETLFKVAKGEE